MKALIAGTLILFLTTPFANAAHHRNYHNVPVVDVSPVYEYVTVIRNNESSCPRVKQSRPNNGAVIGSVIGSSIGHATSDRKHKIVGTVAGAIIGGIIGHKLEHSDRGPQYYCDSRAYSQTTSKQRVLTGYTVSYRVKGKIHQTFSKHKPKKHIRIYH